MESGTYQRAPKVKGVAKVKRKANHNMTLTISIKLADKIKKIAQIENRSLVGQIRHILEKYVCDGGSGVSGKIN